MIHLTHTGYHAGIKLCRGFRGSEGIADTRHVHATYCPIDKQEFRVQCCPICLSVYAATAYDETDEDIPLWVKVFWPSRKDILDQINGVKPCRNDGQCQYAIDVGMDNVGSCPDGKCLIDGSAS